MYLTTFHFCFSAQVIHTHVNRPFPMYSIEHRDNEAKAAIIRARNFQRQANDLRRKLNTTCGGNGARTTSGNQESVPGRTSQHTAPTSGKDRQEQERLMDLSVALGIQYLYENVLLFVM